MRYFSRELSNNRWCSIPIVFKIFLFSVWFGFVISGYSEIMPADPNENFTVRSRVVGPTNRSIAGSSVELYAITDQKELPYTIKRLKVETTDAEGGFEFQIPMEFSNPRKLFVVAQAEGYSIGWEQLSRIIEENAAVGLNRQQGTLEGTVSNQVGQPISNATVRVVIGHSYSDADELIFAMASTPMMTTTTGPDGRFSIPNLPLSARGRLL